MFENRFKKVMSRRSSKSAVALAFLGVALVASGQAIGSASAQTRTGAAYGRECPQTVPKACLWINAADAGQNTPLKLTITGDGTGVADLETSTPEGKGIVHYMPEQFVDNISNGFNGLPYTLCLIDTMPIRNGDTRPPMSRTVMPVSPGGTFTQMDDHNDVWDAYTTTSKGCPSTIRFNRSDGHIVPEVPE